MGENLFSPENKHREGQTGTERAKGKARCIGLTLRDKEGVFEAHMGFNPAHQRGSVDTSSATTVPARTRHAFALSAVLTTEE